MYRITRLNEKGLTLIELLAVIVILGVISMIALIAVTTVIQNMRDKAFVGNALAIKEAATLYIRQEVASGTVPVEKLTYKDLAMNQFIDQFKDPDTGTYLIPSEETYVLINGVNIVSICLKGEKRSLCSFNGNQGIPIAELSADLITNN
ncbi:type II secretion system GspH family protein [Bacillus sp. FJAT-29790]|uniref:type II secretion system protein n=1 Tax=Bacillus sp. FJAT-29790 TaxID=1895002 RepID=UPI001C24C4FC|nr:type II secretion system protein [Bacillus sp. FJAT-29790]MBU8879561.1 type II secretion system GspH family protein [Bacillus sp. FJAT-29790]